jgi:Secretion system C-terminal sorting domain
MPVFTDYLKFSIWADGYYMSSNGTDFVNVFERSAMLTGSPTARLLTTNITAPYADFWCPLPGDADGTLPPAGTPCPLVYYTDNGWGNSNIDAVKIHNLTTNWTGTPSLVVSAPVTLPVDAFDSSYSANWNDVTQGTGTQKIDAIGGTLMYRSQWRRWVGYDTQLLCWAVKMAAGVYSTKWVELRRNQVTNSWSVYQQGTYAPDNLSRWIASIAMDDNGSIGLSYLTTGKVPVVTNPSLRYTGRLKTDPLGQMTFAEQTAAVGSGASPCAERVGDYSHTSLDPDGLTFWHTGMYINSGVKSKVYSFRINQNLGVDDFENQSIFTVFQIEKNLNIQASKIKSEIDVVVDIFDINGKLIIGKIIKNSNNSIETNFDVGNLEKGVYLIRIGNIDFQKVVKTVLN